MVFQTLALLVASLGMYRGSIDSSASYPLSKTSLYGGNLYQVSFNCAYSDLFGSGSTHRPLPTMTATYNDSSSSNRIPVADYEYDSSNYMIHFEWEESLNCSYYVHMISYSDTGDFDMDYWSNTVNMYSHEDQTVDYAWIDVSGDFVDWNTDWTYKFEFYFSFINADLYSSTHDGELYNQGYNNGKNDGYNQARRELQDDINNAELTGYRNGYDDGYNYGLSHSSADFGFGQLFGSIADTPVMMIRRLFNFDLFGMSVLTIVLSLFTTLIVMRLVKKVIK